MAIIGNILIFIGLLPFIYGFYRIMKDKKAKVSLKKGIILTAIGVVFFSIGTMLSPLEESKTTPDRTEKTTSKNEMSNINNLDTGKNKNDKNSSNNGKKEKESLNLDTPDNVKKVLAKIKGINVNSVEGNFSSDPGSLVINLKGKESLTQKMTVLGFKTSVLSVIEEIKKYDYSKFETVAITIEYPLKDKYGNTKNQRVVNSSFSKETIDKINVKGINNEDVPNIADSWWQHPATNK